MGIYIDIALLAIILIFLIVSAKRGFLITLLEVLVFAIAVISAANLCKPAANSIYDTFIGPNITEKYLHLFWKTLILCHLPAKHLLW